MNNIIQFKSRCAQTPNQPTQDVPDYIEFLHSVFAVTEILGIVLPYLIPEEKSEIDTLEFYNKHVAIIRAYTQAIPEFQTIKNPR